MGLLIPNHWFAGGTSEVPAPQKSTSAASPHAFSRRFAAWSLSALVICFASLAVTTIWDECSTALSFASTSSARFLRCSLRFAWNSASSLFGFSWNCCLQRFRLRVVQRKTPLELLQQAQGHYFLGEWHWQRPRYAQEILWRDRQCSRGASITLPSMPSNLRERCSHR